MDPYGIFQPKAEEESSERIDEDSTDFNYTRNRILWATRDNPSVRGIPKPISMMIKKNNRKKTSEPVIRKNNIKI